MKRLVIGLSLAMLAGAVNARIVPGPVISDNMVLQQNTDVKIYGTADPRSEVTLTPSWSTQPVVTHADATGAWSVALKTPGATFEPQTITISDGEPLTLNNILIGEVWLASGQSNMQMPLKGFDGCCTLNGFDEIAKSGRQADRIRFITVPLSQSYTPVDTITSQWVVPSVDTAPDFSAVAWYFANRLADVLNVPVGIVSAAYGGAKVESWTPRDILETYPDVSLNPKDMENMVHYWRPMLMYNAMFHPIRNYTVNGIIWYQGCSNTSTYETYADRLATMVKRWRSELGRGDIPFYSVEIAPYQYDSLVEEGKAAYLREQQWRATELIPNSGIISTNDLVEPYERFNIHPGNKKPVGDRLGNLALNRTYGKWMLPDRGPVYAGHTVKGDEIWVKLDSKYGGICRNYDIRGFQVAGADKVFHPAEATLKWDTNEIIVKSPEVKNPVAVRYCFADWMPGTMYSADYMPLTPFRSDDWKPID